MAAKDIFEVHTSRLWALFHWNFTRLVFPERMFVSDSGIQLKSVRNWLTPFKKSDEFVFFSNIADQKLSLGLFWASIRVDNAAGTDPLILDHVWKRSANNFVREVRRRKGSGPA